jgi:flavin reductase (DIM6/NTAB) family NADH-FMN oxidoreductase RutF
MQPCEIYLTLTQTVISRRVARVLSGNPDGGSNLAPLPFFNALCSDPPLIMISVGRYSDGSLKDTRADIPLFSC